ncbi:MAG: hypothetical protein ABJB05_00460 [Parafilimonas sp.]
MKKIIIQNLRVAFFLFIIQFIVGLILFYKNFGMQTIMWTAILAGCTTLVFIICLGIYQLIYVKTNKISLNDFNIQATQEATFTIDKSVEDTIKSIENNIPDEINSYKFKYNKKLDFYKTKTAASIRSWGEIIIVKLTKIDSLHTQLYVLSEPVYKTTIIDFGKSSMNIQKFKSEFSKNIL